MVCIIATCVVQKLDPNRGQFIETTAVPMILKETKLILFLSSATALESTSRTGRLFPPKVMHRLTFLMCGGYMYSNSGGQGGTSGLELRLPVLALGALL